MARRIQNTPQWLRSVEAADTFMHHRDQTEANCSVDEQRSDNS